MLKAGRHPEPCLHCEAIADSRVHGFDRHRWFGGHRLGRVAGMTWFMPRLSQKRTIVRQGIRTLVRKWKPVDRGNEIRREATGLVCRGHRQYVHREEKFPTTDCLLHSRVRDDTARGPPMFRFTTRLIAILGASLMLLRTRDARHGETRRQRGSPNPDHRHLVRPGWHIRLSLRGGGGGHGLHAWHLYRRDRGSRRPVAVHTITVGANGTGTFASWKPGYGGDMISKGVSLAAAMGGLSAGPVTVAC